MARNYKILNLGFWTPTAGVDAPGRLVFPRRLGDEIYSRQGQVRCHCYVGRRLPGSGERAVLCRLVGHTDH